MIHDLDLVMHWFQSEPEHVEAIGIAVLTDRVDIANARLEFANRSLVNLTASRVSREPMRKLRIFQDDAYLSMDFHAQRTEIFSRDRSMAPPGVSMEVYERRTEHNPLIVELEEFAASVRGESSRMVTAREGMRAVALGARVLESIRERRRALA
jgi:predicted dehydrogenase